MSSPHTPESWDRASHGYDENLAPFTGQYAEALIERLEVDDTLRVLEVAAGSGALTEVLHPEVASVLATDFSPGMIERLRARLAACGASNVECAVMDAQALEVEDESFDRAVSNFGVMLMSDRARAFGEMRRSLAPGGRAVVSAWAGPDQFEMFGTFLAAVQRALPDLPPPPAPPPIFSLADPARFAAEMEAAGFTDVRIDHVERHFEVDEVDAIWPLMTASAPPVQGLLDHIGEAAAERVSDALRELLTDRFGHGPIRLRNVATVGTGRS